MKRAIQNPNAVRAARSIASDSTAVRHNADASLADKFNLAALNGGKSPFEVSSDSLLRPRAGGMAGRSEKQVKNVYSLEYLLGGSGSASESTATAVKTKSKTVRNPFDVASAKLM